MPCRSMLTDTVPFWYGLRYEKLAGVPALFINLHKLFLLGLPSITRDQPDVRELMKALQFTRFSDGKPRSGNKFRVFGFNDVFQSILMGHDQDPEVKTLVTELPRVRNMTDVECLFCFDQAPSEKMRCLHCNGTGYEETSDFEPVYAICASLSLLTQRAYFFAGETFSHKAQLLNVQTMATLDMDKGFSLCGRIGVPLASKLRQMGPGRLPSVEAAMREAYCYMMRENESLSEIQAVIRKDGGLIMSCPGNASGISPEPTELELGMGYEFGSDNVDGPVQQITLLVGLAALSQQIGDIPRG